MQQKSNMEIHKDCIIISISPKIYPLDVIYSAAYVFLDKAYVLLNGNPEKEIVVELRPKEKSKKRELEKLGREFSNELLNYAFYKKQSERNAPIRQAILQRALLTSELQPEEEGARKIEEIGEAEKFEESDNDYLEDPEGIAIPWEEKYGKKASKKKGKTKKKKKGG